jgi:hypothetical protein
VAVEPRQQFARDVAERQRMSRLEDHVTLVAPRGAEELEQRALRAVSTGAVKA